MAKRKTAAERQAADDKAWKGAVSRKLRRALEGFNRLHVTPSDLGYLLRLGETRYYLTEATLRGLGFRPDFPANHPRPAAQRPSTWVR